MRERQWLLPALLAAAVAFTLASPLAPPPAAGAANQVIVVTTDEVVTSQFQKEMCADNDAGTPCTLGGAVALANDESSNPGLDTIHFRIQGGGVHTLPGPLQIGAPVVIDGFTQPGAGPGSPRIEVNGEGIGGTGICVCYNDMPPSRIRGLIVNNWSIAGIFLSGTTTGKGHRVEGNFIGTDAAGKVAKPNGAGVIPLPASVAAGKVITATATRLTDELVAVETTEFSSCRTVTVR